MVMKAFLSALLATLIGCATVPEAAKQYQEPMSPDPEPGKVVNLTFHVDTSCPAADRAAMYKAADIWRSQTGQMANIRFVHDLDYDSIVGLYSHTYDGHNMLSCLPQDASSVKASDEASPGGAWTLGWVVPLGGIHNDAGAPVRMSIVTERCRDPKFRLSVYLHEFGHALGLKHDDYFDTIMFRSTYDGKTTCLRKRDLEAYCEVNNCGTTQTYPCE